MSINILSGDYGSANAGALSDAISCSIINRINGEYELEMEYPISGEHFEELRQRAVLMAEDAGGVQPFRVYRIKKLLDGHVNVYARHLAYDLMGAVIAPFTASDINTALSGMTTHAMTAHGFTFSTTRTTVAPFKVSVPTAAWSLMSGQQGSLLDVYGGEYTFDGKTVTLENRRGADLGVKIRYGVNMVDLEQDKNCANTYTGAVGYWADENGENAIYTGVISAEGTFDYEKIRTVDFSSEYDEQPTVAQLEARTQSFIAANNIGVPAVSWKVEFIPLSQTEEYKNVAALETVNLGDTVSVTFERMGVDASARVVEYEWDVLLGRYRSVTLGSVKSNLADTIANQEKELAQTPTKAEATTMAERISATLTKALLGAHGGYIRLLDTDNDGEPDTLYIADNPDPALAVKVWRFNYEGWGASTAGINGPYTMGATLAGGIMADFITAGTMSADRIYGGSLTLGGNNNQNGKFVINNQNGEPIQESDWTGLNFYSGLYQPDKHIEYKVGRMGFSCIFHSNGDPTSGGMSVFSIGGSWSGTRGSSGATFGAVDDNGMHIGVTIDGNDGSVSCQSVYIDGTPLNWYSQLFSGSMTENQSFSATVPADIRLLIVEFTAGTDGPYMTVIPRSLMNNTEIRIRTMSDYYRVQANLSGNTLTFTKPSSGTQTVTVWGMR